MPPYMVGSRVWEELPKIQVKRIRYNLNFDWDRPRRYIFLGMTESGKSTVNELFALRHPKIVDLFGSRDNENLCWARKTSPVDDILMITGDNVDVNCSWDTTKISDVKMSDIDSHEITLTCNSYWSDQKTRFAGIQKLCDVFYDRLSWRKGDIIYNLSRETMNLIYARLSQGVDERSAKADVLMFLRELRHFGTSFGGDILRWTGIDKEMRDLADFTVIKQMGWQSLPSEIDWLYSIFEPSIFGKMKINEMVMLKRDASIAFCKTPALEFHKEEGVNLLSELGIKIEYAEEIIDTSDMRVGDREHADIVRFHNEFQSMDKCREKFHRSMSTISNHIKNHNDLIKKSGVCDLCKRVGSDLATTEIYVRSRARVLD